MNSRHSYCPKHDEDMEQGVPLVSRSLFSNHFCASRTQIGTSNQHESPTSRTKPNELRRQYTKDEHFWYEDGDVALLVGSKVFRLHASRLAGYCGCFYGLFSQVDAAPTTEIERCRVYSVTTALSLTSFKNLLGVLYLAMYVYVPYDLDSEAFDSRTWRTTHIFWFAASTPQILSRKSSPSPCSPQRTSSHAATSSTLPRSASARSGTGGRPQPPTTPGPIPRTARAAPPFAP